MRAPGFHASVLVTEKTIETMLQFLDKAIDGKDLVISLADGRLVLVPDILTEDVRNMVMRYARGMGIRP
jgi:hypothetical protein